MIPVQKHFPPSLLRHMRKVMRECKPKVSDDRFADLRRWRLAQKRDRWVYNLIAGCVLVLMAFVVAGGCR